VSRPEDGEVKESFGFTGDYILNHLIGDLRWGLNMSSIDEDTNKWM